MTMIMTRREGPVAGIRRPSVSSGCICIALVQVMTFSAFALLYIIENNVECSLSIFPCDLLVQQRNRAFLSGLRVPPTGSGSICFPHSHPERQNSHPGKLFSYLAEAPYPLLNPHIWETKSTHTGAADNEKRLQRCRRCASSLPSRRRKEMMQLVRSIQESSHKKITFCWFRPYCHASLFICASRYLAGPQGRKSPPSFMVSVALFLSFLHARGSLCFRSRSARALVMQVTALTPAQSLLDARNSVGESKGRKGKSGDKKQHDSDQTPATPSSSSSGGDGAKQQSSEPLAEVRQRASVH